MNFESRGQLDAFTSATLAGYPVLNIGSGPHSPRIPNWRSVDIVEPCDMEFDAFLFPWPDEIAPASVGGIVMHSIAEHTADPEGLIAEAWRVLAPGAPLWIRVPSYRAPYAYFVGHRSRFSTLWLRCLDEFATWWAWPAPMPSRPFNRVALRLTFPEKGRSRFLEPLANVRQELWEWLGLPLMDMDWIGTKTLPNERERGRA